jgi:GTP-binding protein HflX
LERQRGGFGFLGGPGETQIEADRRLLAERISRLKRQLEDVRRTRSLHRVSRKRVPYPICALVGYTNAGKSTLFNRLTGAAVLAKDMPFATLDPTMRIVRMPSGRPVILSDTVGFITDLPTELVAAFRATLEEVAEADLLIHVRDIAHPETAALQEDVLEVLDRIFEGRPERPPIVEAWNKVDLLPPEGAEAVTTRASHNVDAFAVSAVTGAGLDALVHAVDDRLAAGSAVISIKLPAAAGAARAWLHEHGEVVAERPHNDTGESVIVARMAPSNVARFERLFPGIRQSPSSEI